jgi:hypothetical protein
MLSEAPLETHLIEATFYIADHQTRLPYLETVSV